MTLQIELLESSFQAIAPQGETFVTAFYERLFTSFPQTRAFFNSRVWASGTSPMVSGQSTIPSSERSCWIPSATFWETVGREPTTRPGRRPTG